MKKGILLGLALLLIPPLLLLVLGMGSASIETARAACAQVSSTVWGGSFGVGTLNWRGASHYARNPHPGERPYAQRVPNMVSKIGASGTSIVGFQEFEPPQAKAFVRATEGGWGLVRGRIRDRPDARDAIAYQRSAWKVDKVRHVWINYGGTLEELPLARFISTAGHGSVWVLNTHNPADAINGSDALRDSAIHAEVKALHAVQVAEPHTPVVLTGDMNDKARFKRLFLSLAGPGWSAANPTDRQIDWIMGGPAVSFSDTVVDKSTNDDAHRYTDHPFVHSRVRFAGTEESGAASATPTPGGTVDRTVTMVQANLPSKPGYTSRGPAGIRKIVTADPDFITLNEQSHRSLRTLTSAVSGYDGYRDATRDPLDAGGGAMDNVVMWQTTKWRRVDAGRKRLITRKMENGHVRSRYAEWVILRSRTDANAEMVVIATHFPVNPQGVGGRGAVHGNRGTSYGDGMDRLIALIGKLAASGPVLAGGDFNDHPYQTQAWAAVPHMTAAGYSYTASPRSGIDYVFFPNRVRVVSHRDLAAGRTSDHPFYNVTSLRMNGVGPGWRTGAGLTHPTGAAPASCRRCPDARDTTPVALTNMPGGGTLRDARVAAAAAHQAGFRGEDLVTAVAIAGVESSWNSRATNGDHFGLWQIAASRQAMLPGWATRRDIFNPDLNARYAYTLYQNRPGAGPAKFADWLPFETTDYHQDLDLARQAVLTATGHPGVANPAQVTDGDCKASPMTVAARLSTELSARVNAMLHTPDGLCGLSWTRGAPCTYDNQCPKVVDALYGGLGTGRGYGDGQDVAQGIIDAGLARAHGTRLHPLPPVGAVVSYNTGDGTGHVAIYVGHGTIFGNDYGCIANGVYGCVGFADVREPGGSITWALPKQAFDLGGLLNAAA